MGSMKAQLTKGAFWLAATGALVNLTSFASTLLLARLLIPADFGLVAMATTVTTVIASLTELSLSSALVHHKDPGEEHFHSAFTLNLARAALIAFVILLAAVPISHFYGDSRLIAILVIISASTLLGGIANPKLVIFSRDLMFRQEFIIGVSQKVAGFAAATTIALLFHSYWALIANTLTMQLTSVTLSYLLIPYRPRLRFSRMRELLSFSIWLSLGQAVNTLNNRCDYLALGYLVGSASLGYYTIGDTLAILPTREVATPLAQTLFPGFTKLTNDLPRLRLAYRRAQTLLFAIALPLGCGFALVVKPVVMLTIGARWLPAVPIVQLLASIFAFQTLASALQPLAMAMGETRTLFVRDTVNFAIRVPLVAAGYLLGGLMGVVWARCCSGLASTFVNMLMVRKALTFSLREQLAINLRTICSVAAMAACTWCIGRILGDATSPVFLLAKVAAMVGAGAGVYVGARYALWRGAGCPVGPESEVKEILLRARLSART